MNAERRKRIDKVIAVIEALSSEFDTAKTMIEEILNEEQEYFDKMTESFQNGDKGQKAQSAIDALTVAMDTLEQVDLTEATRNLEEARDA